jgi:glycosyltransferase involved in cell wall biosynthesis
MKKKGKKVLHILYSGLGGHGNVFMSMVDADKEKAFRYAAVFMGIEPVKEEYMQKCNERDIPFSAVRKKPGFDTKAFFGVYKAIRKHRPDIVFLHTPTNILPAILYRFSRLLRVGIFVRETQPNHLKTTKEWVGLYIAMLSAKRIFFLSEQFRDDVKKKLGIFFRNRKSRVIPNGIDLDIFQPVQQTGIPNGSLMMGMQGRLYKTKDHITLLKALAQLKDKPYYPGMMLRLAGDGVMRPELEQLASDLGISDKVQFLGMLKELELSIFLRSLNIYIHASLGETMSTALMQVMACRLPIIASDVKGINNMVTHGKNGLLVPKQDPQALALAIDELYCDTELQKKLAGNGYAYGQQHFSNMRMWADYKEEFDNYG